MTISIGSTVWVFDRNHRVYRKVPDGQPTGGPIYSEHFRRYTITGETSRSWVLSSGLKVPKTGGDIREAGGGSFGKTRVYMTQQAVDDDVWVNDHGWRLREHVGNIHDADLLRKVAALTGYEESQT